MKIGATTIPLAGWAVDPRQPEASRERRLWAIRQLVEGYGLAAVELSLDLGLVFPQVFDAGFYARLAELQHSLGFTCCAHMPFLWLDAASLNEPIRRASLESIQLAIELLQPVQIENYVLHLWGGTTVQIAAVLEHPAQRQALLAALLAQAERSLAQICDWLAPPRLCLETLEAPAFDFALPLVEKYDVSICLDVGHMAWQGGGELAFLERHAERIGEIHLHDARRESVGGHERVVGHLPLGEGQVDYPALLRKLQEIEFSGAVILEVNDRAALEKSLARLKPFLDVPKR
ncbi:MAG: sugar phosphate isomerase/epimerase [Anaerolineales bacterium]|nr:sugar phosphate isomerase/epimerase [Anaerolineales bacterium]